MKIFLLISSIALILSCGTQEQNDQNQISLNDIIDQSQGFDSSQEDDSCRFVSAAEKYPECPEGHKDSIIPILYGFPSEEMFEQSDSGIISLGGCEVSMCDPNWWCKIHQKSF